MRDIGSIRQNANSPAALVTENPGRRINADGRVIVGERGEVKGNYLLLDLHAQTQCNATRVTAGGSFNNEPAVQSTHKLHLRGIWKLWSNFGQRFLWQHAET